MKISASCRPTALLLLVFSLVNGCSDVDGIEISTRTSEILKAVHQARLLASDAARDGVFGSAASISGDTVVIGASGNNMYPAQPGKAYVFVRKSGKWTEQAKVSGSDTKYGEYFGQGITVTGNTMVVGAPRNGGYLGAAYVFVRSGTKWSEQAKLAPDDGPGKFFLGDSLSLSGETLLVGARNADGVVKGTGAAYVFVRSGTKWTKQAKLFSSDSKQGDRHGAAVALDGDTALLGAVFHDAKGADAGAAYVYTRSGTKWTQRAKLMPGDAKAGSGVGWSVSLSGNTALLGANNTAYVFVGSGSSWTQQAKLVMKGSVAAGAVAIDGNTAVVVDSLAGQYKEGAAYMFTRSGTAWTQQAKYMPATGYDHWFGTGIAISGDTVVSGAPNASDKGSYTGAAYVFSLTNTLPNGSSCISSWQCHSGHCVDGVCCDTMCGGGLADCMACSKKAGAAADGSCGPLVSKTFTCRAATGDCDAAEVCSAKSAACPADELEAPGTVCRASAGDCDAVEKCSGTSATCPADSFKSGATECRKASGDCDLSETCSGSSAGCPADEVKPASVVCRASAGDCDVAENCSGKGKSCPTDSFKAATSQCRASAGDCDVAENCSGSSASCPSDGYEAAGKKCRKATGDCDAAETCTGKAAACPADQVKPASASCRPAAGDCDAAESCDGTGKSCPADSFLPATTVCRKAAGECDAEERCDGKAASCGTDLYQPDQTPCTGGSCGSGKCIPEEPEEEGCQCSAGNGGSGGSLRVVLVLGLLVWRRRAFWTRKRHPRGDTPTES